MLAFAPQHSALSMASSRWAAGDARERLSGGAASTRLPPVAPAGSVGSGGAFLRWVRAFSADLSAGVMLLAFFARQVLGRRRSRALEGLDDEGLLRAWAGGEPLAVEVLVARYDDALWGFLLRRTGCQQSAEDLLQETCLRLVRQPPRYLQGMTVRAWLFRVARNLLIDRARSRRGGATEPRSLTERDNEAIADPGEGQEEHTERALLRQRLRAALATLPEEQREALMLRHDEGLSFPEIAAVLGVAEGTVKSRVRYALEALRGHLPDLETSAERGGAA